MTEPKSTTKASATKAYLAFIIITVIGSIFTVMVFNRLYSVSRQNIINSWNYNTILMSQDIEYYLFVPKDAISFSAKNIEELMDAGASNMEIRKFLEEETEVYSELIDSNSTGVYAYCNGEYLDGSGWIVPKGYDATSRPWYIEAREAAGEIVFVQPYLNIQTGKTMMSVSKLLKDGESVVSMDFFLDGIIEIEKSQITSEAIDAVMVVDKSGYVIGHSEPSEVGKDYTNDGILEHKKMITKLWAIHDNPFVIRFGENNKLIFSKPINNEWISLVIVDEKKALGNVNLIFMKSAGVLAVILAAFLVAFSIYGKKNKEADLLQNEINAISDIYDSMTLIDVVNMKMKEIRVSKVLEKAMGGIHENSLQRRLDIAKEFAADSSQAMLLNFLDLSSLEERLRLTKSVSFDFLSKRNRWYRMYFIEAERAVDGKLQKVLWATESIDDDKRRQEQFRKKAETDALTGILNRSGGESRIFESFEAGKKGLLLLLDADHFKYVNDTFGHDAGDKVIIAIARCLQETFRDSDVVFRLGGDEFCVFAEGVDTIGIGKIVADRLFTNIDTIKVDGVTDWNAKISVGAVFCNEENGANFAKLYKLADAAMYESKQQNGNFITFSSGI